MRINSAKRSICRKWNISSCTLSKFLHNFAAIYKRIKMSYLRKAICTYHCSYLFKLKWIFITILRISHESLICVKYFYPWNYFSQMFRTVFFSIFFLFFLLSYIFIGKIFMSTSFLSMPGLLLYLFILRLNIFINLYVWELVVFH